MIGQRPTAGAPDDGARKISSWIISVLISANVFAVAALSVALFRFGSVQAAFQYVAGQTLVVDEALKSFGAVDLGQVTDVTFQLKNIGDRDLRIVGSSSSCTCTVPDELPMTIEPGRMKSLRVTVLSPGTPKKLRLPLTLYTSNPRQKEVELLIVGEIKAFQRPNDLGESNGSPTVREMEAGRIHDPSPPAS